MFFSKRSGEKKTKKNKKGKQKERRRKKKKEKRKEKKRKREKKEKRKERIKEYQDRNHLSERNQTLSIILQSMNNYQVNDCNHYIICVFSFLFFLEDSKVKFLH